VNFCLVPEVPFEIDGRHGLLACLERRLASRGHAVIVVAEGCAATSSSRRPSATPRATPATPTAATTWAHPPGRHRRAPPGAKVAASVKYIDPSYMIRSVAANASDAIFCDELARYAVHAGMAGRTDVVVGRWHRHFTHVPLSLTTGDKKRINPDSAHWLSVTEATGQPRLTNDPPA
jgi:6-phosphofructokinase 1